jgi:hypothetical protein
MQYPSVRWQQHLPAAPPEGTADAGIQAARDEWLVRTALLLLEAQLPLVTRELQDRLVTRLDEFVDYRIRWDKFAQQPPLREEGGLLLAELDARIMPGRNPEFQTNLRQHSEARSTFSILATLLDGFATDSIRSLPSATQGWACLWLTYLLQWYNAAGPAVLRGKLSRHPRFFEPGGTPEESDFPRDN